MKFFYERVHGMFTIVELLGEDENVGSVRARDNNHSILVGDNNVIRIDPHSIAVYRDIHAAEAVMAHGSGGHGTGGEDWKANLLKLREISNSTINNGSHKSASKHRGTHKTAHAGDICSILDLHDIDRSWASGVDCLEHTGKRARVMVLLFDEFDRESGAGEFRGEDGLHVVRHVVLLVKKLLD